MEPRPDLSPLDIGTDQLRYERLVRRVLEAAVPELRRRAQGGPLAAVAGWARPTLVAAAIIAAVALGALTALDRSGSAHGGAALEAMGVPAPAADWLEDGRQPTASDLVLAMEQR